jgi:hypothetical protein
MKLYERIKQIKALEIVETPWVVKRSIGEVNLIASNVYINANSDNDSVTADEFKQVLEWFVDQFNGKITWKKDKK